MKAEFHFFHTGNGDTIIVRGGDQWGLIDGNFVKGLGVRKRVENTLKGVKRLRFVCITHFDLDHIRGVSDFLIKNFSHKTATGQRVWNIDQLIMPLSVVNLTVIAALDEAAEEYVRFNMNSYGPEAKFSREAKKLLSLFTSMAEDAHSSPEILELPPGNHLFAPASSTDIGMGPWRIVCLGPRFRTSELYGRQIEECFGAGVSLRRLFAKVTNNQVSRVLALMHEDSGTTILLTGDSTKSELRDVLAEWTKLQRVSNSDVYPFDYIKASHHGARSCHLADLYADFCRSGSSEVIISASDDGRFHPHKILIEQLNSLNVRHRVTGAPDSIGSRPVSLHTPLGFPLSSGLVTHHDPQDVVLSIDEGKVTATGGRQSRLN